MATEQLDEFLGTKEQPAWRRWVKWITIAVGVILLVAFAGIPYETWTAIAGSTIYMKFIFDFIISRHAHPIWGKKQQKAMAR